MARDPFKNVFIARMFFNFVDVLIDIASFGHSHHTGYEDEDEKTALRIPRRDENLLSLGSYHLKA
jgi:hypothetical protein